MLVLEIGPEWSLEEAKKADWSDRAYDHLEGAVSSRTNMEQAL